MAVADQIEQVVAELWRLNRCLGWQQRVGLDWDDQVTGKLAKACGSSPLQVRSWLAGESQPPTGAALALMSALPYPEPARLPVPIMNGNGSHG